MNRQSHPCVRFSVWKNQTLHLIGVVVMLLTLANYRLVSVFEQQEHNDVFEIRRPDGNSRESLPRIFTSPLANMTQQQLERLRTNRPIFVVGYPKVGTTSIYQMFQCSGIKSQHYCCCGSSRFHTHCRHVNNTKNVLMADCIRKNMKRSQPILQQCGSYELFAQMDGEFRNRKYIAKIMVRRLCPIFQTYFCLPRFGHVMVFALIHIISSSFTQN